MFCPENIRTEPTFLEKKNCKKLESLGIKRNLMKEQRISHKFPC